MFKANHDLAQEQALTFCIPYAKNMADVDSIILPDVLVQVTVSDEHSFNQSRVLSLGKTLCMPTKSALKFIYVVPESKYQDFKYQVPEGSRGKKLNRISPHIHQFVMYIPDELLPGSSKLFAHC